MKNFFYLYSFLFMSLLGYGQNEIVDIQNFDTKKLNLCLVDYMNQLRSRKRRNKLSLYEELNAAAKNHAQYMAEKNYLGHLQKNKSLKTVKDRVQKLGGDADFVGENVQYLSIDYEIEKSNNKLTYAQLAQTIGENWKKSRGHYANIIDKMYSGVAHQFALKEGVLYVCQVLSSKPF